MRVWLLPSAFAPHAGGVEELTLKLAHRLVSSGIDVRVITNRWPRTLAASELVEGIPVTRLPFTMPRKHPGYLAEHYRDRRRVLAALDGLDGVPDLLHVQCASTQLFYASAYARARRLPLLITTQGETEMDAGRLYQRSAWMRARLRSSAESAAALSACSGWAARRAQDIAPAFARAQVIPNGVDLGDWCMDEPGEAPVIAAWGRLVPQKGFDLLVAAFRLLRTRLPGAELLLGGTGEPSAAGLRFPEPGVTFLGPLDRSGVKELLSRARVVAVPSRIEPFGIVALEALAAGRGLVYSVHGGLQEAAGPCGRAADPFDAPAFARALFDELEQPTPAAAARARAQEVSWDVIADRYQAWYRSVLR